MEQGNMYATEATPIVDIPLPPVNINIIPDNPTDMAFNTSLNNSSLNTSMNTTSLNVSNGSMNTPPVVPVTPEEGQPRQRDSAGTAGEVLKGVEFQYDEIE